MRKEREIEIERGRGRGRMRKREGGERENVALTNPHKAPRHVLYNYRLYD